LVASDHLPLVGEFLVVEGRNGHAPASPIQEDFRLTP
jgi:hypothetical protein